MFTVLTTLVSIPGAVSLLSTPSKTQTIKCDGFLRLANRYKTANLIAKKLQEAKDGGCDTSYIQQIQQRLDEVSAEESKNDEPQPSESSIVQELTTSNFDEKVRKSDSIWVIDLYGKLCGGCIDFEPEFEKAAEELKGVASFGSINDDHMSLQEELKLGTTGWPAVRLVIPGNKSPITYTGPLTSAAVVAFVRQHTSASPDQSKDDSSDSSSVDESKCADLVARAVIHCNAEQVGKLQAAADALKCERSYTDEIAQRIKDLETGDDSSSTCTLMATVAQRRNNVTMIMDSLSTLTAEKCDSSYSDRITMRVDHLKCASLYLILEQDSSAVDSADLASCTIGQWPERFKSLLATEAEDAAEVQVLTESNFDKVRRSSIAWVVHFSEELCEACIQFEPEFAEAAKQLAGVWRFGVADVKLNEGLGRSLKITKVPTVQVFLPGGESAIYDGERTASALVAFLGKYSDQKSRDDESVDDSERDNEETTEPSQPDDLEQPRPVNPEQPGPVNPEQPSVDDSEGDVEETTEPSQPDDLEQPRPVNPEQPRPVNPEKTRPVNPEKTRPVNPEQPRPVNPEKTKPVNPEQPRPVNPEKTKPVNPEQPSVDDSEGDVEETTSQSQPVPRVPLVDVVSSPEDAIVQPGDLAGGVYSELTRDVKHIKKVVQSDEKKKNCQRLASSAAEKENVAEIEKIQTAASQCEGPVIQKIKERIEQVKHTAICATLLNDTLSLQGGALARKLEEVNKAGCDQPANSVRTEKSGLLGGYGIPIAAVGSVAAAAAAGYNYRDKIMGIVNTFRGKPISASQPQVKKGLSRGAIVGIVLGALALVGLAAWAVYRYRQRQTEY